MELWISLGRALFGMAVLLFICYLLSTDRRAIDWRIVLSGIGLQIALAILILKVPGVSTVFDYVADAFRQVLVYAEEGAVFLFGALVSDTTTFGYIFAFQVLPAIVFFSAIFAILYYFGILQVLIKGIAWVMNKTMRLSGPEGLAAAANVFIGQTEAPLIVKPYLEKFTRSEMMCLMTGGLATIAGSVFAAYVGLLGGTDPEEQRFFAKHLLTASIISAPAAIVAAKIMVPETGDRPISNQLKMADDPADNVLDAITRGTTDGLKLAINVGVMLLVFTALVFMLNQLLINGPGDWFGWNEQIRQATGERFEGFSFTWLLGVLFAPFAWLLGVPWEDALLVGQLLGQKTVINEFVAYTELNKMLVGGVEMQPKSLLIATYALCGFANFASIGILIGGIGALAPGQREVIIELSVRALIAGTIACFMTGAIAGVLVLI